MYVKIIDCGECFSTTMEYINGVYANKTEWAKHNFYPQNGMVGEVVKCTPTAFIVKIKDGIYIPMTARGIREISAEEYQSGQSKNVSTGMNKRQQNINNQTDNLIGNSWQQLPDMRQYFETDIIQNMKRLTNDFTRNIYLPDLEQSAIMYATDLCLEFRKKSGRTLDPMTIDQIATQVLDVYLKYFSADFHSESIERCKMVISDLANSPRARNSVDSYYARVNSQYNNF